MAVVSLVDKKIKKINMKEFKREILRDFSLKFPSNNVSRKNIKCMSFFIEGIKLTLEDLVDNLPEKEKKEYLKQEALKFLYKFV